MRTPTRSLTLCGLPSRPCANGSASQDSSPLWRASGTASRLSRNPLVRGQKVDRTPGLSVRLKLTLSYACFLMLAAGLLFAAVWFFLLRYVPDRMFIVAGSADFHGVFPIRSSLLHAFAPAAALVLTFLLVFGLVGGWLLAGRMLAPLNRLTEAARLAAKGS